MKRVRNSERGGVDIDSDAVIAIAFFVSMAAVIIAGIWSDSSQKSSEVKNLQSQVKELNERVTKLESGNAGEK